MCSILASSLAAVDGSFNASAAELLDNVSQVEKRLCVRNLPVFCAPFLNSLDSAIFFICFWNSGLSIIFLASAIISGF